MKKIILLISLSLTGCQAPLATIPARQIEAEKITLGNVQSKIKVGVSGDVVIDALGSPNIVTSNDDGSETWVYDKVSNDSEYSKGWSTGVKANSSRTMMVVVKFDKQKKVKDVKYRQTTY
jgi:outer membrane protein assembly factor BamE (lipoprotein component of BamABCDE complex)